jgi:hypothetical protein
MAQQRLPALVRILWRGRFPAFCFRSAAPAATLSRQEGRAMRKLLLASLLLLPGQALAGPPEGVSGKMVEDETGRGWTAVAFDQSVGSSVAKARYYEQAALALEKYLKSRNYCACDRPHFAPVVVKDGTSRTWYAGKRGSPHIEVSRPMKDFTGLGVSVVWRAAGPPKQVDASEAAAKRLVSDFEDWWRRYQQEHPRPGAAK